MNPKELDDFFKDINNIDFSLLSDEEKQAIEKEMLKVMYAISIMQKHNVDIMSWFTKDTIAAAVAEANDFLMSDIIHKRRHGAEPSRGQTTTVVEVSDYEARTYDHKDYLKELGLHFSKKVWVGCLDKGQISELRNAGLAVREVIE